MGKVLDLTGEKYNRLTVIEQAGFKRNRALWLCLCDCGNYCEVTSNDLRTGNTKSCGCLDRERAIQRNLSNAKDLSGTRRGKLLIQYKHKIEDCYFWHCLCDCGKEVDIATTNIYNCKSCGCLKSEKLTAYNTKDIAGIVFGELTAIKRMNLIHNSSWVWLCKCSCGNEVYSDTHSLMSGTKKSCGCIKSEPEEIIRRYLESRNIAFVRQKQFPGCRDKKPLYFDFYLIDSGCVIEYDGEFHYRHIEGINDLPSQQRRDDIKTQYCKDNHIPLLRIPYWEKDNIESILTDWLFLYDADEANSSDVDLSE